MRKKEKEKGLKGGKKRLERDRNKRKGIKKKREGRKIFLRSNEERGNTMKAVLELLRKGRGLR